MARRRVLILCTGNSCRSQMAEGLINHFLAGAWQAESAGTAPAGYVHPLAIQAMAELGIDLSDAESKSVERFRQQNFDAVITVCDDASEHCPAWLGPGRTTHIGFPDPARASGAEADRLDAFRAVRDGMRQRILAYLSQMETT